MSFVASAIKISRDSTILNPERIVADKLRTKIIWSIGVTRSKIANDADKLIPLTADFSSTKIGIRFFFSRKLTTSLLFEASNSPSVIAPSLSDA